ncbi:hypothetical protein DFH09DRAFT_1079775 [Mycena vulgaris]|nr:hypothetical protein DFH09DRAFT_1079775 [Mycena vulgaris]
MGRGLSRDGSPPRHRASDLDLAVKWGLSQDDFRASQCRAAKRLETPHGTNAVVDASAAVFLETSHVANCVVDDSAANANVISAEGELLPWSLPAVDRDSLRVYPAPYISRADLEEYMLEFPRQFSEDTEGSETTDLDVIVEILGVPTGLLENIPGAAYSLLTHLG